MLHAEQPNKPRCAKLEVQRLSPLLQLQQDGQRRSAWPANVAGLKFALAPLVRTFLHRQKGFPGVRGTLEFRFKPNNSTPQEWRIKWKITLKIKWKLGVYRGITYLWLAGNEGIEKKMETILMGCIGTTIRTHSFIPS